MPFGTSYTTDPGLVSAILTTQEIGSVGSSSYFSMSRSTTGDLFQTARFNSEFSSSSITSDLSSQISYTSTFESFSSSTYTSNATLTAATLISGWAWGSSRSFSSGSFSSTSGESFFSNTTYITATVPMLTLVGTVLSTQTYTGHGTITKTWEESILSASSGGTFATTRTGTALDTTAVITISSQHITTVTTGEINPATARTFRVTYPDVDELLFVPVSSSGPRGALGINALTTSESYAAPSAYTSSARTVSGTLTYPRVTTVTESASFSRLTVDYTSFSTIAQFWETSLNVWSTQTTTYSGLSSLSTTFSALTAFYTSVTATGTASTITASITRESTEFRGIYAGLVSAIRNAGSTTLIEERSLTSYSSLTRTVASASLPQQSGFFTITGEDSTPSYKHELELYGSATNVGSFALVPRRGAVPPLTQMSASADMGIGLTGIPAGWEQGGLAFNYSTINREGASGILAPVGRSIGFASFTYSASIADGGVTLKRTVTDTVASTSTAEETTFAFGTLATLALLVTTAKARHYMQPATHTYGISARIRSSGSETSTAGPGTITAPPGASLRVDGLPFLSERTMVAAFATPTITTP